MPVSPIHHRDGMITIFNWLGGLIEMELHHAGACFW